MDCSQKDEAVPIATLPFLKGGCGWKIQCDLTRSLGSAGSSGIFNRIRVVEVVSPAFRDCVVATGGGCYDRSAVKVFVFLTR